MGLRFVICADTVDRTFNLILVVMLIMLVIVGLEVRHLNQVAVFSIIEVFLAYLWHFSVLLVANQHFETLVRS